MAAAIEGAGVDATIGAASGPALWTGADQAVRDWRVRLSDDECEEIVRAAENVRGVPLDAVGRVEFPLQMLATKLAAAERTLAAGTGFVMLRGLPVGGMAQDLAIQQATEEGHPLTSAEEEALAFVDEVADRPGLFLDMDFRPGDIQFLNNRTILHARTDYVDHPDEARKRLLLRLWLMMPHWPPRPAAMTFHVRTDKAGGGVQPVPICQGVPDSAGVSRVG